MTQNLNPLLQRAQTNGIHFEMKGAVAIVALNAAPPSAMH